MEFVISISRPVKSWNLSHLVMEKQYAWQADVLKIEKK